MKLLRKVLYWDAAAWALSGAALAALPKFILVTILNQAHYPEYAWIRIVGAQSIGLAALMVLVAQRLEDLWWFSWVFVLVEAAVAAVAVLNALFGLPHGASSALWWLLAAGSLGLTVALLWGMALTGQERPFA